MQIHTPIVSTAWLAEHINDPSLRLFDTSIYLTPRSDGPGYITEGGRARWAKGHLPGANFLDMLEDFTDTSNPIPMMRISDSRFEQLCGQHGISNDSAVVLYSGQTPMWAARMWWMLRAAGFTNAAILDGGPQKWAREGRELTQDTRPYKPAVFVARPRPELWVDKDAVLQAIGDSSICMINALQPDVYDGQINRYGRRGHIPGSHNVYYSSLIDKETNAFLSMEEIRKRFETAAPFGRKTILYCGGGVSAAIDAIALAMLGHEDLTIYDGSMYEWCLSEDLPLVSGPHPG